MTAPTTEQPVALPPFDPTNPHISEAPASMTAAVVQTTVGTRVALTVRHPAGSATVFLQRDDALNWAHILQNTAQQMSGLIVPGLGAPLPNPQG